MSKTVRERNLGSPTARAKLKSSGKPYYRPIYTGLHLGYRKGLRGGVWVSRCYLGHEKYLVETIGVADDRSPADGKTILNYDQAQEKAREKAIIRRNPASSAQAPTVRDAVEAYCEMREAREEAKRGVLMRDARSRLTKHVLRDKIADKDLSSLTESALKDWRGRLSGGISEATVRRLINDFKAALNGAARVHRKNLPMDMSATIKNGLESIDPVASVAREAQVLPDADVRRLIDAAWAVDARGGWDGDLARLVIVLAATGARFSQAIRMTVAGVQTQGRLMVPVSHKGRGEKTIKLIAVRVGDDVLSALRPAVTGRKGPDALFERWHWHQVERGEWVRERRGPWRSASELSRPWNEILRQAGLPVDIVPYALRHSSIVRGLRAGLPVRLVANLHDTGTSMIDRHYAAYVVDAMDELAARAIVPLTSPPVSYIRPIEQARL